MPSHPWSDHRLRAAVLALVLALSACSPGDHVTDIDKSFVADMAPHHALGVRLAAVALRQADDVRVREFGFTMGRYQQAEFTRIETLAKHWKAQPSSAIHGMLTDAEENDLAARSGSDFDRAWLRAMIHHHEGAVAMAQLEAAHGSDPSARQLAADIVTVQLKEIGDMKATLADLGG